MDSINQKTNPKVSVIITTYNRSGFLTKRAIPSVLSQTYKNLECIIVDDGSTDNTEEIVKEFIKRDNRLKYFKIKNSGLSAARNFGIKKSNGEYIAFLDDDDEFLPEYLKEAIPVLQNLPTTIGALSSGFLYKDDCNLTTYIVPPVEPFWSSPIGNGCIFRREVFFDHQLWFDENLRGFEDLDLRIRFNDFYDLFILKKPLRRCYYIVPKLKEYSKSFSGDASYQVIPWQKFFEKNHKVYEKAGREALSWITFFGGALFALAGNTKKGKSLLWESFQYHPTLNCFFYLLAAHGGSKTFHFYHVIKSHIMRFIRAKLINRPPNLYE